MRIATKIIFWVGGSAVIISTAAIIFLYFTLNSLVINLSQNSALQSDPHFLSLCATEMDGLLIKIIVAAIIGLLIFVIQLIFISRKITCPLNQAIDFSNSLAKGDFSRKLPRGNYDYEIAELVKSLNFMRDRLQNAITKLRNSHSREKIARKDAESANSLKSDFLANMSLELRNPLNSIMGFASLILKEIDKGLYDEELKRKVSTIRSCTENLNNLITNLLELSRLDADEVDLNLIQFDTSDFMRDLIDFNLITEIGRAHV